MLMNSRLAVAVGSALALLGYGASQAAADSYTYSRIVTNSAVDNVEPDAVDQDQWSLGESWDVAPVSASNTTLVFSAVIPAARNVFTNNDFVGNFQLNALNMTYTGPGSSSAPTITISGNALEFVTDGITAPVMTFNTGGVVKPNVIISNNLILTNNLLLAATTNATLSGAISGGSTLTKSGAGLVSLTGPSTYSGLTVLNEGILQANLLANNGVASSLGYGAAVPSAADLVFGGGTLRYVGSTISTTDRLFTIGNANGSTATIDNSSTNDATFRAVQFTNTGPIAFDAAATHTLTLTGTHTGLGGAVVTRTLANANTLAAAINDAAVDKPTNLVKSGTGAWVITNVNGYTGGTTVSAGRLTTTAVGGLGSGAVVVENTGQIALLGAGTYANLFTLTGTGPGLPPATSVNTVPGAMVLNNGAIVSNTVTLAGDARISAGELYSGTTQTGTISGKITGTGQLEFSSGGAGTGGTITVSNPANDYSGGTRVSAGGTGGSSAITLVLGASNVLPDGNLALNGLNYAGGATVRLNGFNETIGGLNSAGRVTILTVNNNSAATESTLTVGAGDANGAYLGTLTNGSTKKLHLTKIGAGTQVLGRGNGYTGVTRVEAGVLEVDFGGATASTATAVTNYLSTSSDLQLAGGTFRLKPRLDGTGTSETLTISSASPRALTLASVAGISVGQFVSVDSTLTTTYIQQIEGNTLKFNTTLAVTTGSHTIGTEATSFTHAQTLASLAVSADSTIDFGSNGGVVLTFTAAPTHTAETMLTIDNWSGSSLGGGLDQLVFNQADPTVFTSVFAQDEVQFIGHGVGYSIVDLGSTFEVTPVPEPTTLSALAAGAALLLRRRRRGA